MMEYLADEKAYELKMKDKPSFMRKRNKIEKIYLRQHEKSHQPSKEQDNSMKFISGDSN